MWLPSYYCIVYVQCDGIKVKYSAQNPGECDLIWTAVEIGLTLKNKLCSISKKPSQENQYQNLNFKN